MNVPILYEDNHLLIVEKPINMPVQEDESQDSDLLSYLKEDVKKRYNKPGNVYMGLIHRLDRPVGGVMVFAKTSKAASRMADTLRKQELERTYVAIVRGTLKEKQGRLTDYLIKDRRRNKVHLADRHHKDAKKAILDYTCISMKENLSLVSIQLQTGRSHQIRVQMKAKGTPLYGDQKYGGHVNRRGQQIALWAYSLAFEHPVKKERVQVTCPPPKTYPWNLWKENEI